MKLSYNAIIKYCFLFLAFIIFCNINGVLYAMFKINAPLSPLILFTSILGIVLLAKKTPKPFLKSNLLLLFLTFFISYLVISIISGLVVGNIYLHYETSWIELLRGYIATILIIYFFYLLTIHYTLEKFSLYQLFDIIAIFVLIATIATITADTIGLTKSFKHQMGVVTSGSRAGGFFSNPNEAGAHACFCLSFMLAGILRKKYVWFYFIGVGLSLYAVFLTFSRSALIIAVFLIFLFLILSMSQLKKLSPRGKTNYTLFFTIVIGLSIYLPYYFINNVFGDLTWAQQRRLLQTIDIVSGHTEAVTESERGEVFELGLILIERNPVIGNGLGSFHKFKETGLGVHNAYFVILGESGFFPFLLLLIFIIAMFINTYYLPQKDIAILGILLLVVILLLVLFPTHGAFKDRGFNALLGILLGLIRIKKYVWN